MYQLSPSILSADFNNLGRDVAAADSAGAQYLHIDVMDGAFVPNISFGMPIVKAVRGITQKVLDVHLMIADPDRYIQDFADCGADIITVHAEACRHLDRVIQHIHSAGLKAGVALNPATSLTVLDYVLDKVEMVLIMTVNPGFGGQQYHDSCTGKIRQLRTMINERRLNVDIQVDGGINETTIHTVLAAGANVIVAGSAIFNAEDVHERVKTYLNIMKGYQD